MYTYSPLVNYSKHEINSVYNELLTINVTCDVEKHDFGCYIFSPNKLDVYRNPAALGKAASLHPSFQSRGAGKRAGQKVPSSHKNSIKCRWVPL